MTQPAARRPRIAYFPDSYLEVDGLANTARHFEAFARKHELPLLLVHAGVSKQTFHSGSVTRIEFSRGALTFPLDRAHRHDLNFWRHYREIFDRVQEFAPEVLHITGPSDVGMLGALVAHKQHIPLAASWQTNVHQYARSRLAATLQFLPQSISRRVLDAAERQSLRGAMRFYKIPRLLFAPNREMIDLLTKTTGKPCYLMAHSVDPAIFNPAFRDHAKRPFTLGYVGRLTPEKNVRLLAQLERALIEQGHRDFRFLIVGDGVEREWLSQHMKHAEFTGVLTGRDLSRAFANLDLFIFPSQTDTFGLVVLEAMASGVPAIVGAKDGPKDTVQHGRTGYVANGLEEFAAYASILLRDPDLLPPMRVAARNHALTTSWEDSFMSMCDAYTRHCGATPLSQAALAQVTGI